MKAERTVKRITFNPTEANPGETLYVYVPKLAENEVIVAGSLALVFNINLKVTGAHANNYLVQNVSRALVDKLKVKFAATTVQDTDSYSVYKTFEDLFLSRDKRANMLREGIQSDDLNKIRSGAGDKKTSGVDAENKLNTVYGTKYRINLDHPILTDHGVFYPQALHNDLLFELTLAPANQVGVQLTHDQVKRMSDKEVEKLHKRQEAYIGSKTTESLIDSFLMLISKGLGLVVKIDNVDKLQQDLKNDYIINHELSSLAGGIALSCGRWLALANAALITTKHVQLEKEPEPDLKEPATHPSRDKEGYPLEGIDEV